MKLKYLTSISLILTCIASANAYSSENNSLCNLGRLSNFEKIAARNMGSDRDGGIGGTGIFAEITSTNPLKIAGCKVVADKNVKVIDDFAELKIKDLKTGQFVYMTANIKENELLTNHIILQHLIEGPVTKVLSDSSIEVMGQIVQLTDRNIHFQINSKEIVKHDYVKVSGLRLNDGSISATRVDVIKPVALAGVTGKLEIVGSKYLIGGIAIAEKPEAKLVGSKILAIGKWNGGKLENVRFKQMNINKNGLASFVISSGVISKNNGNSIQLIDDPNSFDTEPSQLDVQNFKEGSPVIVFGKTIPNKNTELLDILKVEL
jgi:hypothetical protein